MIPLETVLPVLRCPQSGAALIKREGVLESQDGAYSYPISDDGILLFAGQYCSADSLQQQQHYDRVAKKYVENLSYPHTQEYMRYLDECLFEAIGDQTLGNMLEVCCGHGEALSLLEGRYETAIGIDISHAMLRQAKERVGDAPCYLMQGDATHLPLESETFDSVVTLGGIHHVRDRDGLFSDVYRVLRPGGRFIWREPLNDFFLWSALRQVIYRLSPALDHETEEPLEHDRTVPLLLDVGFGLETWRPAGFLGFCFLMNSDVLVFNRLFRVVPGIRALTRAAARFDDWVVKRDSFKNAGLQVIGVARRPPASAGALPQTTEIPEKRTAVA